LRSGLADPARYHSLSFAPLSYIANAYRSIGAEVINMKRPLPEAGGARPVLRRDHGS